MSISSSVMIEFNAYYILYFSLLLLLPKSSSKLLFVHEHFRHGARGAVTSLKSSKDLFGVRWDYFGELTAVGERQMFVSGRLSRLRYDEFLGKEFDYREILVYGTHLNRSLVSADMYLKGLFYNERKSKLRSFSEGNFHLPPIDEKFKEKISGDIKKLMSAEYDLGVSFPIHQFQVKDHFFLLNDNTFVSDCKPIDSIKDNLFKTVNLNLKGFVNKFGYKFMRYFNLKIEPRKILNNSFVDSICENFVADYESNNLIFHIFTLVFKPQRAIFRLSPKVQHRHAARNKRG